MTEDQIRWNRERYEGRRLANGPYVGIGTPVIQLPEWDSDTWTDIETTLQDVGDPQELIISGHSSTDLFDDDAVAGRRHLMGRCADVGVCAAAG